jgi:hypothetical protein
VAVAAAGAAVAVLAFERTARRQWKLEAAVAIGAVAARCDGHGRRRRRGVQHVDGKVDAQAIAGAPTPKSLQGGEHRCGIARQRCLADVLVP